MVPGLLMLIVWHSGFVSTQPSEINKLTNAVVVSKEKIDIELTGLRQIFNRFQPDVT